MLQQDAGQKCISSILDVCNRTCAKQVARYHDHHLASGLFIVEASDDDRRIR